MKTKALVARTRDGAGYNAIVFDKPDTLERIKGCEFSIAFLFGPFTKDEIDIILPCVDDDQKRIVQVA